MEDRIKALEREVELLKQIIELREKLAAYERWTYVPYPPVQPSTPYYPMPWYPTYFPSWTFEDTTA